MICMMQYLIGVLYSPNVYRYVWLALAKECNIINYRHTSAAKQVLQLAECVFYTMENKQAYFSVVYLHLHHRTA